MEHDCTPRFEHPSPPRGPQAQRTAMLEEFREGRIQLLICSDAMTRGIDIDGVAPARFPLNHGSISVGEVMAVVNYDAPLRAKTYIHRSGRTARARASKRCVASVAARCRPATSALAAPAGAVPRSKRRKPEPEALTANVAPT